MAFSIRKMKETDAAVVCELSRQLGYELDIGQFFGRLSMISQNSNHSLWVADSAETGVVGFIHLEKTVQLVSEPRLEVMALVISKKMRGTGLGKRLMKYAESFAKSEDLNEVTLTTNIKRDDAHAFYEKLGFIRAKTSHRYTKRMDR
jgi:N-acetylglutamate synthase-like GNAT family acetyltransferase